MKNCDRCKKNQASVHLTEIRDGKREKLHLCEECARELKVPHKHPISVADFLGVFMDKDPLQGEELEELEEALTCPDCGISFEDFKKKGRFGCANDYRVFARRIVPILRKIHGSSKYIGKVPASGGGQPVFLRELLSLRRRLKDVIRSEEYEEAARVRDRIAELENLAEESMLKEELRKSKE